MKKLPIDTTFIVAFGCKAQQKFKIRWVNKPSGIVQHLHESGTFPAIVFPPLANPPKWRYQLPPL